MSDASISTNLSTDIEFSNGLKALNSTSRELSKSRASLKFENKLWEILPRLDDTLVSYTVSSQQLFISITIIIIAFKMNYL